MNMIEGQGIGSDADSTYFVTGDYPPPLGPALFGPVVCDCGYGGRHSELRHWFRLRYLKERW